MRIYHSVPNQIEGTFLQPLNILRKTNPELYSKYVRKYEGREFVLSDRVLNLNCLWNDVLHFSPVHPKLIGEALLAAGFDYEPSKWFSVDPAQHSFNSSDASILLHLPTPPGDRNQREEEFIRYTPQALSALGTVPLATLDYYKKCYESGTRPLLFCWVPHVLFRGELEISSLEIITA